MQSTYYDVENLSYQKSRYTPKKVPTKHVLGLRFILLLVALFGIGIFLGTQISKATVLHSSKDISDYSLSEFPQGLKRTQLNDTSLNQHLFLNVVRSLQPNAVRITHSHEQILTMESEEFLREYVLASRPLKLRGYASNWDAISLWDYDAYFYSKIAPVEATIEKSQTNKFYETKVKKSIHEFLDEYSVPGRQWNYYLAGMNIKNTELVLDLPNVPTIMDSEYFTLDIQNIWVGAGDQITPLHTDTFDNFFCQISGTKVFQLYDPFQVDLLRDHTRRFIDPEDTQFPLFKYAEAIEAHLEPGDCLFVPVNWIHLVKSGSGRNVAVNWYFNQVSQLGSIPWKVITFN